MAVIFQTHQGRITSGGNLFEKRLSPRPPSKNFSLSFGERTFFFKRRAKKHD
jgi:hypothetical protein